MMNLTEDNPAYIKTYVLYTISTEKHEPKEPAIHYGTFQHNDNAEPVRPMLHRQEQTWKCEV